MIRSVLAAVALALALLPRAPAYAFSPAFDPYLGKIPAETQRWFSATFRIYRRSFVKENGRVVDPQNDGITHSESQGYGMMLALLGDDPETFHRIWTFARRNLQRPDNLFCWKYEPGRGVTDRNNATDGELLIATGLALAAVRWDREGYIPEAVAIAEATGRKLVIEYGGYRLLLPGEWGAPNRHTDAATINLSYFIPMTLEVMESLAPEHPWETVYRDGYRLLDELIHPPSDWTNVNRYGEPNPAVGFPPLFSYDAVRIPLYLLMTGEEAPLVLEFLEEIWGPPRGDVIYPFDVLTMRRHDRFWGNAYHFIHELLHCANTGEPVRLASLGMDLRNYFASSLHMMGIAALYANYPQCFPRSDARKAVAEHPGN